MSTRIALATCTELPHLDADEEPLVAALTARGVSVEKPAWDAGDAPFVSCDLTVIRSTWDYTARVDEFVKWAARIEAAGRIYNPASVVRWNTHKRYLQELAREGVPVVPTALVAAGGALDVRALLLERGWTSGAVVKPAVSAGSRDTVRIVSGDDASATEAAQALVDRLLSERDMMVQPFIAGIARGELSLHYIEGKFTHAVNKVPRGDDFRSQPEFGSAVSRVDPTASARAIGEAALRTTGGNLLYARVDLVQDDDEWRVMELELVEPSMYLRWAPDAADAFADAIVARARKVP